MIPFFIILLFPVAKSKVMLPSSSYNCARTELHAGAPSLLPQV